MLPGSTLPNRDKSFPRITVENRDFFLGKTVEEHEFFLGIKFFAYFFLRTVYRLSARVNA